MNEKEMFKYDTLVRKCILYIHENCEEICKAVDNRFDESKDYIRQFIIEKLKASIVPGEPHYEWYYDGCPFDYSGDLKKKGTINLDQTVSDFLENEYTGASRTNSHAVDKIYPMEVVCRRILAYPLD